MKPVRVSAALLAASLAVLASGSRAGQAEKFEKSYPFDDKEHKVGIRFQEATIDSFRIRNWPDPDELREGEKDLNDTHTMVVEFTYSNRNEDEDFKCHYWVTVPGKEKDGKPWGEDDRTATLTKGKIGDTNKVPVKMKTYKYKEAKNLKVVFEVWRKD